MPATDRHANAATRDQWDATASGWHRQGPVIRDWLRLPTKTLFEMAGIAPGQAVLDVAAGAGDQTLDLAGLVGPSGRVVATDISPGILAHAATAARAAGHRCVETCVADAEHLDLPLASFDAAICRLGLMFLTSPLVGLAAIRRALKPGARAAVMVFAAPDQNPCLRIIMSTALRHAGLGPRDPFQPGGLMSLGRPGHLEALFTEAGFHGVTAARIDAPFRLPRTADYVAFLRDAAGPVIDILARLSPAAQDAAWADITSQLEVFQTDAGWVGPNSLILTAGTS